MITSTQFETFKADAIRKQPIRKSCLLSDLKFHTMDQVEYAGITLGINRSALKDIIRIIGFSVAGTKQMESSVGEQTAISILNSLKSVIGSVKKEVTLVVTPDRIITAVTPSNKNSLISIQTYFDTFERLANDHKLEITNVNFNETTGSVSINSLAGSHEHQIGGFSDEVFRTGFSFTKTIEGFKLDPFQQRLVCTNGMVTRQFEESYALNSMQPKVWSDFYQHLERIEKSGFLPTKFSQAVNLSMQSSASLNELERGIDLITKHSNCKEHELEMFFKGLKRTQSKFFSAGIDCTKLTLEQKRNLRTGVTHWDLINGITDFASHNYGFEKKPNTDRHLQMQAGDLLAKTPDTTNLILNQPF